MSHFENVSEKLKELPFMKEDHAMIMKAFIHEHGLKDILEIGFFKGKSTAYFAAILEDIGEDGHVTTIDRTVAKEYSPNIFENLESVGLQHRVTPVLAFRSHTWELGKLARQNPRPRFDMCYFDGGHTWDVTGFGFVLVDMLLKPGGWIVFDDLDWTISESIGKGPDRGKQYRSFSQDEKDSPSVRMVLETLAPHLGYVGIHEHQHKKTCWGFAQKPCSY